MRFANHIFIILILCMITSCNGNRQSFDSNFDKELYTPVYSSGFDIKGAEGQESVLITVRNPWQGADSVVTYLLVARNGENPPEGFDGQVLKGDAKRIVVMSSTHIAMLDALDETDRIVGVSLIDYVNNPEIQRRRDSIGDVGYEGNVNYELLMSLEPDIVLLYGVNGANPMEGKLRELRIPYMYVGDYLEEDPLGKAEWIVALSELTGNRERGEEVFSVIPQRYNALKHRVAESVNTKPKVMVNAPYGDTWHMPPVDSYAVRLIGDAGGDYLYNTNTGNSSIPIDIEEAYRLVSEADVWINLGTASSLDDVKTMCPKFTGTRCLSDGNVYNNNLRTTATGGNDYFESGVVNPDIVLRDLVKIFHPELVEEDFVYYKHLR